MNAMQHLEESTKAWNLAMGAVADCSRESAQGDLRKAEDFKLRALALMEVSLDHMTESARAARGLDVSR